jgi:hypothetical protein
MTRQEFLDDVYDFRELMDFCYDNDCGICDDIYDDESKDEYINEHLSDMADNADDWQSLYRTLDYIPTGYDYYRLDDYDDFNGLDDDDFDDYKNDVLEWMDDNEYWDEDEDDEEEYFPPEEEYSEEEDDEESCEEDMQPVDELFSLCSEQLRVIDAKEKAEEQRCNEEFLAFTAEIGVVVNEGGKAV